MVTKKSRIRSRARLGLTALAVLCVGAALAPATSAAASAPARATENVRVIEQNIDFGRKSNTLPNLESQFRSENPDVVMVVEICRAQVQQLEAAFPAWHVHYSQMRKVQSGCAKASGGVADPYSKGEILASPHSITAVTRYGLADSPHDTTRAFHMTCGNVMLGASATEVLRACVTHLRNGRDAAWKRNERMKQAGQVAAILKPQIAAGRAVVLSGDFNAKPTEAPLDALYGLDDAGQYTSSGGQFDESQQADSNYWKNDSKCTSKYHCRSGEATVREPGQTIDPQGRYDDIFYSRAYSSDLHGFRLPFNGSDHYPITSTAKLSLGTS